VRGLVGVDREKVSCSSRATSVIDCRAAEQAIRQLFHADEKEQAQQGEIENDQRGTEGGFFLLLLLFVDSEHRHSKSSFQVGDVGGLSKACAARACAGKTGIYKGFLTTSVMKV
jgi:hypothetical protein